MQEKKPIDFAQDMPRVPKYNENFAAQSKYNFCDNYTCRYCSKEHNVCLDKFSIGANKCIIKQSAVEEAVKKREAKQKKKKRARSISRSALKFK